MFVVRIILISSISLNEKSYCMYTRSLVYSVAMRHIYYVLDAYSLALSLSSQQNRSRNKSLGDLENENEIFQDKLKY